MLSPSPFPSAAASKLATLEFADVSTVLWPSKASIGSVFFFFLERRSLEDLFDVEIG